VAVYLGQVRCLYRSVCIWVRSVCLYRCMSWSPYRNTSWKYSLPLYRSVPVYLGQVR